jgi:hypothetical protein
MWNEVLGDWVNARITPIEQGQYIGLALTGSFNAFGWRNHGGIDPDTQRYSWQSTSSGRSAPWRSTSALQGHGHGRRAGHHPHIDRPGRREQAAEQVNEILGAQVHNIWLDWARWGVVERPYVNGPESNVLPDGAKGVGLAFSGRHQMDEIWCDDGKCERGRPAWVRIRVAVAARIRTETTG